MKVALRVVLGLVVLLIVLAVGAVLFIDSLAKTAVEKGGTHAMGVETKLANASIGLTSGEFALSGLEIANPPGFAQPAFFALGKAELELPLSTLMDERITIPALTLDGVTIDLERNAQGTNYGVILDNLKRFETGEKPSEPAEGGKQFVLQKLVIRDVRANVDLLPAGGELTKLSVTVPEIVMQDLGSDMTLAQICALVVKTVIHAAIAAGGDVIPAELLADLKGRLGELQGVAEAQIQGEIGKVEEQLQQEAKKLGPGAEKALEKASDKVDEKLQGLFKKKKD